MVLLLYPAHQRKGIRQVFSSREEWEPYILHITTYPIMNHGPTEGFHMFPQFNGPNPLILEHLSITMNHVIYYHRRY